jgi:hypothetical protein
LRFAALAALPILASAAFGQSPVPPAPGELVVSEIMFTPVCSGSQNTGEWFEVTNISTKVLDVNGLYFQDGSVAGINGPDKYFRVLPSVATLPPLYPGQRFVFARSADPLNNGGLPQVDYSYAQDVNNPTAPADHSKVSFSGMNFSSQDPDGMHISLGAPVASGGTLIDTCSYNPVAFPFSLPYAGGGSAERIDLFQPFTHNTATLANSTNMAQALQTATFGSCVVGPDWGTPGTVNSTDATIWPMYTIFNDSLNQNPGTIQISNPPSVGGAPMVLHMANGVANAMYTLGYSSVESELPLGLILGGNPGALLLDINTTGFLLDPGFLFDGAGNNTFVLTLPGDPGLVGQTFSFQWLTFDPVAFYLVASHGVRFTICD